MRVVETQQRHVTVQLGHILYLVAGRGRCGIRLFVWVTECCPSACESDMSKKFNVTESLRYKGVAKLHRLEFPAFSDLARNMFCMMATTVASEQVFNMAGHVVNRRRANLKSSSVNDILFFSSAAKAKKRARLTKKFHNFTLQCF